MADISDVVLNDLNKVKEGSIGFSRGIVDSIWGPLAIGRAVRKFKKSVRGKSDLYLVCNGFGFGTGVLGHMVGAGVAAAEGYGWAYFGTIAASNLAQYGVDLYRRSRVETPKKQSHLTLVK
jgi:hypothetical protein